MSSFHDGPRSVLFAPLALKGNVKLNELHKARVSKLMKEFAPHAPSGSCTGWGVPFEIRRPLLLRKQPVSIAAPGLQTRWLIFSHTTDVEPIEWNEHGRISPMRGAGRLGEIVADYIVCYDDGAEVVCPIRRRHQIGMFSRGWGENCFECVPHNKYWPVPLPHEQAPTPDGRPWGNTQTRVGGTYAFPWTNWLWAWENPHPAKAIVAVRLEPRAGTTLVFAVTAGDVTAHPLRWNTRRKAVLKLPRGIDFDPTLDEMGRLKQIRLDMGQVISAQPRRRYPNDEWAASYNNQVPEPVKGEVLIEYTAHSEAQFHFADGRAAPAAKLEGGKKSGSLTPIASATQRVRIRTVEARSKKPVAVKLHVHGQADEYLAPVDRHRIPNPAWYEDYSVDFLNQDVHYCTYVPGETDIDLPLGKIYLEVSKGFEIRPVRMAVTVSKRTKTITVAVKKVLPWRERGWVTADTHVHFLSPPSARLEGAGEGVNVVNLLASQWGELMTNVGDFDGETTHGSKETGGDGEWLVRVGTENRQHVMGHISLLGYDGNIIAPMTAGGPDEAALGDPIGTLLTEWARQCHRQGGLVVIPHFPNPRAEHAVTIAEGQAEAVEMTAWGNLYGGIDPYSLSDWYRYLNCGYHVAAVGGTDKMSANTAVGAVRTYAHVPPNRPFDYDAWMDAVRDGNTFVTYGPLMEFAVEGKPAGSRIEMRANGGTVDVTWQAASVTIPMSRIELIVNGEIRESRKLNKWKDKGHWSVRVDRSSWIAILIRGHYADKPEVIAAHSSAVTVALKGSAFLAAADAVTILEQIEGVLAYFDTVGTRADTAAYKRMRLTLTAAHRRLHNRMHESGHYHQHTPTTDHKEHH